jgi:hypothetical protein
MDKFVGCVFDRENNIITLMTEEQYIEYGKKLRKECGEKNKEKIKESNKKYREEHKEEIDKYREENKEEIKLKQKEYYEKNKELIKEKTKLYREQHKEELKQKKKEYRELNKEKLLNYDKQYYTSKILLKNNILDAHQKFNDIKFLGCHKKKVEKINELLELERRKEEKKIYTY